MLGLRLLVSSLLPLALTAHSARSFRLRRRVFVSRQGDAALGRRCADPAAVLQGPSRGPTGIILIPIVQWHPFLVAAPLKIVLPKTGSLFLPGSLNN